MINIAVMGYGTVGSGVVEVIQNNRDIINEKAYTDINIKYVLDLREFPGDPVEKLLTHDFETILNDDEVKIVVEVMGGLEPAHTFVAKCLKAGKSVCTSNKELVAKFGPELLKLAGENNVNFFFEASCGGGIPIIRALNDSITADRIKEISGILNGTTNYILTKMETQGWDFDTALKSAQEKGYAERNPEADIDDEVEYPVLGVMVVSVSTDSDVYNYQFLKGSCVRQTKSRGNFIYIKALITTIIVVFRIARDVYLILRLYCGAHHHQHERQKRIVNFSHNSNNS